VSRAMTTARPRATGTDASAAVPRPIGLAGRLAVGLLVVAGVIVGAPSGFGVFWFVPYAGVGALLAIRRPRTSIGWILLGLGWCLAVATLTVDATAEQFATGSVGPITAGLAVITSVAGMTGFVLFALLAIVFPSGHMPSGRWRRPAQLAVIAALGTLALSVVMPFISVNVWGAPTSVPVRNPAALLPDLAIWQVITPDDVIVPVIVLLIVSAVSVVVRYRRATGVERQQLRWFTAALAFVVIAVLTGFVVASLVPGAMESGLAWLGAIVAFPCVAIAVGIAVLRYRLYEIDRIISRTIGWTIVTGLLVAVFAAGVVLLQAALAPFTNENTLAVAGSTLIAFALFQPLRRRVQVSVDRRFDRARYDGQRVVAAFAERLRSDVDLASLRSSLAATADQAVRPTSASVWLTTRGSR
jgi:hypothetical protein